MCVPFCSTALLFSIGVVLEDVVCEEFQGIVRSGVAHFVQCLHDSWHDGRLQVCLGGQRIDADFCLARHGRKLSPKTFLGVLITTLWVEMPELLLWDL